MFHFQTEDFLACTPKEAFELVYDVESYPSFLPWCVAVQIVKQEEESFLSRMTVGFPPLKESFVSRVTPKGQERITVTHVDSHPFSFLENTWLFFEDPQGCRVCFDIHFRFSSFLMEKMMGRVFLAAQKKLIASFKQEAFRRYAKG